MFIPFNKPPIVGTEIKYIQSVINTGKLSSNGIFTYRCQQWIEQRFHSRKVFLTPSCTSSLEIAAILINVRHNDEIIMPSYTFSSTANAFVLRGAKIIFVDIHPDTMNIDERLIETAITNKTKAIVPVHYGGVPCEMDTIMTIAKKYNLYVIEDAAHGFMSTYKKQALGTIGHIGCFSFHETKNYTSGGEGGALLINDDTLVDRAEIIREKGTNRSQFFHKKIDKYTWCDIGSNCIMTDLQAAYLWAQLEIADNIHQKRLVLWKTYRDMLGTLVHKNYIELQITPSECMINAHIFYIKLPSIKDRDELLTWLERKKIHTTCHYVPLHSSPAGKTFGKFVGKDIYTTKESGRLLRLPLFYNLTETNQYIVISTLLNYFS